VFGNGSCFDDPKPKTDNRTDLTGIWIAEGYQCPWGTSHTEIIDIVHDLKTEEVKATKVTGDACVTAGNITFTGKYSNNKIEIILRVGSPSNPNSGQRAGSITVVNDSLMKGAEGVTFKKENLFAGIPDCPCRYDDLLIQQNKKTSNPEGQWSNCGTASQAFHYGAAFEVRWYPTGNNPTKQGQQCTYDKDRKLITSGIAAGSPDRISPKACGNIIGDIGASFNLTCRIFSNHCEQDVLPWREIPCEQYLRTWSYSKVPCGGTNPVNDIQQILSMVKGMTCEQITYFLQGIDNPLSKTPKEIVDFFHKPSNKVPANLRNELTKVATNCLFAGLRKEYDAVQKVIANIP
jgi:hypothetical protein